MGNSPPSQRKTYNSQSYQSNQENSRVLTPSRRNQNDNYNSFNTSGASENNLTTKENTQLLETNNLNIGLEKNIALPNTDWVVLNDNYKLNSNICNENTHASANSALIPSNTSFPNIYQANILVENKIDQEEIELNEHETELQLIPSVLSTYDTEAWLPMNLQSNVLYVPIQPGTKTYEFVTRTFFSTAKGQNFKINQIYQVQNPVTFGQFLLKKYEMESRYKHVAVELLFHGSSERNIYSICENNFNWRLCINSKFGHGVSFSPISTYACYSCEKVQNKEMLACLVLIAKECVGVTGMQIPDLIDKQKALWCDTAIKNDENRSVVVKFSDHEFYPLYRICFTGDVKKSNALVRRR